MPWFMQWLHEHEKSDLIYKKAAEKQIMFVRDTLSYLVNPKLPYVERPEVEFQGPGDESPRTVKETALVVGEHRSKSVRLPVYAFERPDLGLRLMMRDNFYNWKLSVLSERPIVHAAFPMLFKTEPPPEPDYTGDDLSSVYFEGFREDWCFRYYSQNQRQWSAQIGSENRLWTVIFLIMDKLGDIEPLRYQTREEHRAQLDREYPKANST